jgi:hypothetical protein
MARVRKEFVPDERAGHAARKIVLFSAHGSGTRPDLFELRVSLLGIGGFSPEEVSRETRIFLDLSMETMTAVRLTGSTDTEGFPAAEMWDKAPPIRFDRDWQGKNPDPERATEVRVTWAPETLYLRFIVRFRTITVFGDAEPNGRRDHLWDRDVAETFLQPPELSGPHYREIEVSPNNYWIDLDIAPGGKRDLQSGLARRTAIDRSSMIWRAELALPMKSLTARFSPDKTWRANFYRVEGAEEPRFYSAWRATNTAVPNFHVPEAFGTLAFES